MSTTVSFFIWLCLFICISCNTITCSQQHTTQPFIFTSRTSNCTSHQNRQHVFDGHHYITSNLYWNLTSLSCVLEKYPSSILVFDTVLVQQTINQLHLLSIKNTTLVIPHVYTSHLHNITRQLESNYCIYLTNSIQNITHTLHTSNSIVFNHYKRIDDKYWIDRYQQQYWPSPNILVAIQKANCKKETINLVVLYSHDGVLLEKDFATWMSSMVRFLTCSVRVHLIILDEQVVNKTRIYCNLHHIQCVYHHINIYQLQEWFLFYHHPTSQPVFTLTKLVLEKILYNLRRVLVLDLDMIFVNDVCQLYDNMEQLLVYQNNIQETFMVLSPSLDSYYNDVASIPVRAFPIYKKKIYPHHLPERFIGVNSGMFFADLEQMRNKGWDKMWSTQAILYTDQLDQLGVSDPYTATFHLFEQTVINIVFRRYPQHVAITPPHWHITRAAKHKWPVEFIKSLFCIPQMIPSIFILHGNNRYFSQHINELDQLVQESSMEKILDRLYCTI